MNVMPTDSRENVGLHNAGNLGSVCREGGIKYENCQK